jgi:hypothetical protein
MSLSFRKPRAAIAPAALAGATLAGPIAGWAILAAFALVGARAHAGSWDFNPRVELGGLYDDNYRLVPSGESKVPAYGTVADVSFAARWLDQRYEFDVAPRVHNTFFPDDHTDQSTDGYVDLSGKYNWQRATIGALFNYSNETVIASELLSASFPGEGLGQTTGEETGLVSFHNRRVMERFLPNYTYDFSPRWHLKADGQYENASFSQNVVEQQGQSSQFFVQQGFKDYYGRAGVQYDFSQRYDLVSYASAAKFLPDGSPTDTLRYGVEETFEGRPNQILQYYARLGVNEVHAHTLVDGNIDKTLVVGGAGVTWTYQLSQYTADFIRDLSPSAGGAVVEHDEVRGRILKALTPRLYAQLAARYVRVRGASSTILGIVGSDYTAASGTLQYQITRSYRLSAEYDYTWQRFQREPSSRSNGITLSVIWQPLSRFNPVPDLNRLQLDRAK